MPSFFLLELDTTAPTISIALPTWTTRTTVPVIITSNEELDNFQDIYMVDSQGNRFDSTFLYLDDSFEGIVDFSSAASGRATIYARLRDTVRNEITAEATILVTAERGARLNVTSEIDTQKIVLSEKEQDLFVAEKVMDLDIEIIEEGD
jgi:hypothetical protein